MRGASSILVVSLVICMEGCDTEQKRQNETLATALVAPVREICTTHRKEGGGCNGECVTRVAAADGRALDRAAVALEAIPPNGDVVTEQLLAAVRSDARAVHLALSACGARASNVDENPIGEDTQRCAVAVRASGATTAKLDASLARLADDVEKRTRVRLPSTTRCRGE